MLLHAEATISALVGVGGGSMFSGSSDRKPSHTPGICGLINLQVRSRSAGSKLAPHYRPAFACSTLDAPFEFPATRISFVRLF